MKGEEENKVENERKKRRKRRSQRIKEKKGDERDLLKRSVRVDMRCFDPHERRKRRCGG